MTARRWIAAALVAACACAGMTAADTAAAQSQWRDAVAPRTFDAAVFATLVLHDTLYAGGNFDRVGAVPTGPLAAFDGQRWSGVGLAAHDDVIALGEWRGRLVAATHRYGSYADRSAYSRLWLREGAEWTALGDSVRGEITAIATFRDSLVVAGRATYDDRAWTTLPLYVWNGDRWRADADTLRGGISTLAVYHDALYIGGSFTRPSKARAGVARRGPAGWETAPLLVSVRALAVVQDRLWALASTGLDSRTFGADVPALASFDGTVWRGEPSAAVRAVSYGTPGTGGLLAVGDSLFVGDMTGVAVRLPSGAWRSACACPGLAPWGNDATMVWLRGTLYLGPMNGRDGYLPLARLRSAGGEAQLEPLTSFDLVSHLDRIVGLAVHDGLLFVETTWGNPAVFDGATLREIGGGLLTNRYRAGRGSVRDIGGSLYASAHPDASEYGMRSWVARWSDAPDVGGDPAWRAVPATGAGLPLEGYVNEFCAWRGAVIAGGSFSLGPLITADVAQLDATGWHALGSGFDDDVYALCVYHGALYAGGRFTAAGGEACSHIAWWDGLAWREVGGGIDGDVEVMRVYGDRLIVGGRFTHAGGAEASSIVAWDGAQWATLGGGTISGRVWSLAEYRGDLIAGGSMLLTTPRDATFGIGRWHDGAWASLGGGLDGSVYALAVYGSALYAGGEFKNSLGFYTGVLRVWDDDAARSVDGFAPSLQAAGGGALSAPLRLAYFLPRPAHATLAVFDARGRRIATLDDGTRDTGQHTVVWDPRATLGGMPASGVYTIALEAGGRRAMRRVVWLR